MGYMSNLFTKFCRRIITETITNFEDVFINLVICLSTTAKCLLLECEYLLDQHCSVTVKLISEVNV